MKYKNSFVFALMREMELRREYLEGEPLDTLYFGGGTPSQLQAADFEKIFDAIHSCFEIASDAEITLEANPDDLTPEYTSALRSLPFNRISMGVQSFDPADLRFLNRRHTAEQALRAVALCKENSLTNISLDLIYGLPGQTEQAWQANLDQAIRLDIPHLSAYHLIYEEGTALYKLLQAGKISPVDEEVSVNHFSTLIDTLAHAGYEQYEISNFARPGYLSRHNSSYWTGKSYLGLGPSAHSYNGTERAWNKSSLALYLKGIADGVPDVETETLDLNTRYNDAIITGLRTMWGVNLNQIQQLFGKQLYDYCLSQAATHVKQGTLLCSANTLTLSKAGIFISDSIMSDLLWV